jgi:uncharacterized protein (DUF736 family)
MATIATLTKQKDGGFLGTLSTLALHAAKMAFVPVENPTDKGPVYRVLLGESEIGAGWKRTSKAGNAYISVKLDADEAAALLSFSPTWRDLIQEFLGIFVRKLVPRMPAGLVVFNFSSEIFHADL